MINNKPLNIRSYTWLSGATNLSWVYVMERLGASFEKLGHNFYPISTNGYEKSYFGEQKILQSIIDLDKLRK